VGAVIGSKQMNGAPSSENTCAAGNPASKLTRISRPPPATANTAPSSMVSYPSSKLAWASRKSTALSELPPPVGIASSSSSRWRRSGRCTHQSARETRGILKYG
jgi:hypothetical protein